MDFFTYNKNRLSYNIIFTLASIPPVISAMLSIKSGCETYALIQRGKTYSGIEEISGFYNAGFLPKENISGNFHQEHMDKISQKIAQLHAANPQAFFNIFVQDATALFGAAIAANAGLSKDDFHVFIIEDGVGAYSHLGKFCDMGYEEILPVILKQKIKNQKLAGKLSQLLSKKFLYDTLYFFTKRVYFSNHASAFIHNIFFPTSKLPKLRKKYLYDYYCSRVLSVQQNFEDIMSVSCNKIDDPVLKFNFINPFPLASLENFSYILQDRDTMEKIIVKTENPQMVQAFLQGNTKDSPASPAPEIQYLNIHDCFSALDAVDKEKYLSLIFGSYYNSTYSTLTRSTRCGKAAPEKKLLFFQYHIFGSADFIGLNNEDAVGFDKAEYRPVSYECLNSKYRNPLVFSCEDDYRIFTDTVAHRGNYPPDMKPEDVTALQKKIFNYYVNYIFQYKLTYSLYGEKYDFIVKGHPAESLGFPEEWPILMYSVEYNEGCRFKYSAIIDRLLGEFHSKDSVGKYIGNIPYSIPSENLAYLNADITLAGHTSSSYTGFDDSTEILFIISDDNDNIANSKNINLYSNLGGLLKKGRLSYTDESGNRVSSCYFNTGNIFKNTAIVLDNLHHSSSDYFSNLYSKWLKEHCNNARDIDNLGYPVQ